MNTHSTPFMATPPWPKTTPQAMAPLLFGHASPSRRFPAAGDTIFMQPAPPPLIASLPSPLRAPPTRNPMRVYRQKVPRARSLPCVLPPPRRCVPTTHTFRRRHFFALLESPPLVPCSSSVVFLLRLHRALPPPPPDPFAPPLPHHRTTLAPGRCQHPHTELTSDSQRCRSSVARVPLVTVTSFFRQQ